MAPESKTLPRQRNRGPASGHWEHFPHQADMGVRGYGNSKEQAFEQAALALTAVITDPQLVKAQQVVHVTCEAPDDELLLADWLNALIYEMSTRKMLFGRFKVKVSDNRLGGKAWGEPVDAKRHEPAVEVKGATYTSLRVAQEPDQGHNNVWVAQCVVDV